MKPLYKNNWFKVVTGIFILCLLFISFLPYAIRYGIEQWYLKQGADSVSIEDVDLNLFTGNLHIKNLTASKDGAPILDLSEAIVEFDWLPLFEKHTFFPRLHINGLKSGFSQLKDGTIVIAGVTLPKASDSTTKSESAAWGFGLHAISINDTSLNISTPTQNAVFGIDEISLDRIESWSQDNSQLIFSGKINNSALIIKGNFSAFSDQPVFEGNASLTGLDISPAAIHLKDQLQSLKGILDLHSDFTVKLNPGKSTQIQTKTEANLKNLSVKFGDSDVSLDKLNWQGSTKLQLTGNQSLADLFIQGKINTENTVFSSQQKYHYHHEQLSWNGSVKTTDAKTLQTQINGKLDAKGITFKDLVSQQELFHTGKLNIEQLAASGATTISAQQIAFQQLRALFKPVPNKDKQKPALLQAASLSIDSASLKPDNIINLGNILFKDALIHIDRLKDGRLQQLALLQPDAQTESKQKTDKPQQQKEKPRAFNVAIKQIDLGGKSKIQIIDRTVNPAYKTELNIKKANIRNINSTQPDSASPYVIDANLDKYSTLKLEGDVYPFSSPLSIKLKGKLVNINLPPVSGYTAGIIGYDLRSGQLNAELNLNIDKGKIDSNNNLTLSNLEVKPSDPAKSEKLTSQLSMPLDSALSLLRDKNNDIKLNLPVSGDINKPDFDISGIINKAIGTAMKKASLSYLTHALQPYGSLITLAKLAKAAADHVSLNPILFPPASSETDDTAQQYATKIASLMTERPQLRIKLCGKATLQDSQQLIQQMQETWKNKRASSSPGSDPGTAKPPIFTITDEQLLELALQRSDAVKNILVNDHKIDASRLFLCQPAIDKDKDAQPRLDLTI